MQRFISRAATYFRMRRMVAQITTDDPEIAAFNAKHYPEYTPAGQFNYAGQMPSAAVEHAEERREAALALGLLETASDRDLVAALKARGLFAGRPKITA